MRLPAVFRSEKKQLSKSTRPPPVDPKHAIERVTVGKSHAAPEKPRATPVTARRPGILARCQATKLPFLMIVDALEDGTLLILAGERAADEYVRSSNRPKDKFVSLEFDGLISSSPDFQCPHCGDKGFVKCGCCQQFSCHQPPKEEFFCGHCGNRGIVQIMTRFTATVTGEVQPAAGYTSPPNKAGSSAVGPSTAVAVSQNRGVTRR